MQRATAVSWAAGKQRGPKTDAWWQGVSGEARRRVIFGDLNNLPSVLHSFPVWPWRSHPACFCALTQNSLSESVSGKVCRTLRDTQMERGTCLLGLRVGWHLRTFMTICNYSHPAERRAAAFRAQSTVEQSWEQSGSCCSPTLEAELKFSFKWAQQLTSYPSLQPSTCSSCQHAQTTKKFILKSCLSQCSLCLSVRSLIWKTSVAFSTAVQPKPLCCFVSDPSWLSGGVDCLCADNFKYPQSSLETLQSPSKATILCCRTWTIPPPLLVIKGKSSQERAK